MQQLHRLCMHTGEQIALHSAADLLVAGRFQNFTRPIYKDCLINLSGTVTNATVPGCRGYSSDKGIPWVVADYTIELTVSNSRLDARRKVNGSAQLDLFLCGNAACQAMVDLQYVSNNSSGSPVLAMAYTKLSGSTIGLPQLYLPADTKGSKIDLTAKMLASLPDDIMKDTGFKAARVAYPSNASWMEASPAMVPVGTWARAISAEGGLDRLKVGIYKAVNMNNTCIRVIYPTHEWMDAHGWGHSHQDCEGTSPEGLYAFHSYFPQAFWWEDRDAVITTWQHCDKENTCTYYNEAVVSFQHPPASLNSSWQGLEKEWQMRLNKISPPVADWMSTHGRSLFCDYQSQSISGVGVPCYVSHQGTGLTTVRDFFTGARELDDYSCNASRDRCVVAVIGSAPVVLWDLTAKDKEHPSNNQKNGSSPLRGIPERFLLPLIRLTQEKTMPWCDTTAYYWTSAIPPRHYVGITTLKGDLQRQSAFNCSKWGMLGFANGSGTAQGPATQPLSSSGVLVPAKTRMSFEETSSYGFVGYDRPNTVTTPQVVANLVKAAARRLYNQCALQASLTDATATWKGGLMTLALTVVSIIAVASSRRDLDDVIMRLLRGDFGEEIKTVKRCIVAKLLSLAIAGLTVILPPLLGVVAEESARRLNAPVRKVMWLSMPAHGQGHYHLLMAMAITMVPDYDEKGRHLVRASLALAGVAVVLIGVYSGMDLHKRCFKKPSKSASEPTHRTCSRCMQQVATEQGSFKAAPGPS